MANPYREGFNRNVQGQLAPPWVAGYLELRERWHRSGHLPVPATQAAATADPDASQNAERRLQTLRSTESADRKSAKPNVIVLSKPSWPSTAQQELEREYRGRVRVEGEGTHR